MRLNQKLLRENFSHLFELSAQLVNDFRLKSLPDYFLGKLNKDWVIGFIEAEGCFSGANYPIFSLSQHTADHSLLVALSEFLGCGNVTNKVREDGRLESIFQITSKTQIAERLIPLCEGSLFCSYKREQFNRWVIKYFPELNVNQFNPSSIPSPQWITGFTEGDGSFYPVILRAKDYKFGYQVQLYFCLTQILIEKELLLNISKHYFDNKGKWSKSGSVGHMKITAISALNNSVVPFFLENSFIGRKQFDFTIFLEMLRIVNNKEHLLINGPKRIEELRSLQHHYRKLIAPDIQKIVNAKITNN